MTFTTMGQKASDSQFIQEISVVGGLPNGSLIRSIRSVFEGADEALLCIAFANRMGVALLEKELRKLGPRSRILLTTVFGSSTASALGALKTVGCDVRILNLASGTFHPKVYLGQSASRIRAAIGSANLTSGLVKNVEVMSMLSGSPEWEPIRTVRDLAEDLWRDRRTIALSEMANTSTDEVMDESLSRQILGAFAPGTVVRTLAEGRENVVAEVSAAGIFIETERSRQRKCGPQLVESWMIQLAWDYLTAHGQLSNHTLQNELRVHRSSAVCALLAQLPSVAVESTRPIRLRLRQSNEFSSKLLP